MQVRIAWGIWWLGLTLAWAAAAAPWQGMAGPVSLLSGGSCASMRCI